MALPNGLKVGKTYRFKNLADGYRSLNVYSVTSGRAPSLANVCLFKSSSIDTEQQWVIRSTGSKYYLTPKSNPSVALDMYTGPITGQKNVNAHLYSPSSTSYITFDDSNYSGCVQIKLSQYNNKYLTANQGGNGTNGGRIIKSAGNVYWYKGGLPDMSQDWKFIEVDGGGSHVDPPQGMATTFPWNSYYNKNNNSLRPGECTWYCIGRAHEYNGTTGLPTYNANRWIDVARDRGFEISLTPRANSIACFPGGNYGHVAYVENVNGNQITYSECNWYGLKDPRLSNGVVETPPEGSDGQLKPKSKNSFENMYGHVMGYIYI